MCCHLRSENHLLITSYFCLPLFILFTYRFVLCTLTFIVFLPQPIVMTLKADRGLWHWSGIFMQRAHTLKSTNLSSSPSFTSHSLQVRSGQAPSPLSHSAITCKAGRMVAVERDAAACEASGTALGSSGSETSSFPPHLLDTVGSGHPGRSKFWVGWAECQGSCARGRFGFLLLWFSFWTSVERCHGVLENIYIFVVLKF